MPCRLYVQVGGAFSLCFGIRHGRMLLVPGQPCAASSAFWQELAGVADFPQEAMAMKRAGWTGGRCSALHVPTQRAAMTDAARCDGLCTALHHRAGNGVGHQAAVRGRWARQPRLHRRKGSAQWLRVPKSGQEWSFLGKIVCFFGKKQRNFMHHLTDSLTIYN